MSNCAILTVLDSLPPTQDCTGNNYCKSGCPGATTVVCTSPDPCIQNICNSGCQVTVLCGFCGNVDTTVSENDPSSPCYITSGRTYCEDFPGVGTGNNHCMYGCPDSTSCGKCGNPSCSTACGTNPCANGCPDTRICGKCNNLSGDIVSAVCNATIKTTTSGTITTTTTIGDITPPTTTTTTTTTTSGETDTSVGGYTIDLSPITNNLPTVAGIAVGAVILGLLLTRRN